MQTSVKGFLLDEKHGKFTNDNGQEIEFRNARFYDVDESNIFKASIPDNAQLPAPQQVGILLFNVKAGERFCKLEFAAFEGK